ncbi:MAG: phosphotransferase family protein [Firmicutes bacterium]|nr:phosphotransferase family protein [Bacillota bacterium]
MTDEEETIPVRPGDELQIESLLAYLRQHLSGFPNGELRVRQYPTGASNLTYLLEVGSWQAVLRRPPRGPIPPKAHDMRRESMLLEHIAPLFPLAPKPYLFCDDETVIGAPFYVMEHKRGFTVDDAFPPDVEVSEALCEAMCQAFVESFVAIHTLDYTAAGLEHFGHPHGFVQRQVQSWIERYQRSKVEEHPYGERLCRWLSDHIPAQQPAALIHNDYKVNNIVWDHNQPSKIVGILDWEMATIGDPLFDLGVSLSYWFEQGDPPELQAVQPTVTSLPMFWSRRQIAQAYAVRSGRDLSDLPFYLTFGYFRLAVVLLQIYARYLAGGASDDRFAAFGTRARVLLNHAWETIQHAQL